MKHYGPYHTALSYAPELHADPIDRAEFPDGIALAHDAWSSTLPAEFDACDVIWAEPPWPAGYAIFNERAKVTAPSWSEFHRHLARLCEQSSIPIALLGGARAVKLHPNATPTPIRHNGDRVFAICYRLTIDPDVESVTIIHRLCEQFDTIGDFCCGYGRTGLIAREHGKRFVLSDHNAECIGVLNQAFGANP
jgi:hypothetical protein